MDTSMIDCFLAAAESSSFSKAAQGLFMAQPTFGRHIAALEQELGYPLFVRGTKGNTLTAAGEVLYKGFCRLKPELLGLLAQAGQLALGQSGQLTVGLLEGQLLDSATAELFWRFKEAYPNIRFSVSRYSFHAMLQAILNEELDIGITLLVDVEQKREFEYLRLYSLPNELVYQRSHPLAGVPNLKLSDFSEDTFVEIASEDSSVISALMRQTCRNAGFEAEILTVPDLKAQILAVETGAGIAAFNCYHQACNHPNLCHIPLPDFPNVDFCAVWKRGTGNPAVGLFRGVAAENPQER